MHLGGDGSCQELINTHTGFQFVADQEKGVTAPEPDSAPEAPAGEPDPEPKVEKRIQDPATCPAADEWGCCYEHHLHTCHCVCQSRCAYACRGGCARGAITMISIAGVALYLKLY